MKPEPALYRLPPPELRALECGRFVVRDDLLIGGTKLRAIMPLIAASRAKEFVYASPAQGYAQLALALGCQMAKRRATIFVAYRRAPSAITEAARAASAQIMQISPGYLSRVEDRAREYAEQVRANLLPFGCDCPIAISGIVAAARSLNIDPPEVWSVAGSGVLQRALQIAWPRASFVAVCVSAMETDTGRARRIEHPLRFEQNALIRPPFPSAANYDAKAWEYFSAKAPPGALLWNAAA